MLRETKMYELTLKIRKNSSIIWSFIENNYIFPKNIFYIIVQILKIQANDLPKQITKGNFQLNKVYKSHHANQKVVNWQTNEKISRI